MVSSKCRECGIKSLTATSSSLATTDLNPTHVCEFCNLVDKSQIYLILYIHDMLIARSNGVEIRELKQSFHEKFVMKELGQAKSSDKDSLTLLVQLHS